MVIWWWCDGVGGIDIGGSVGYRQPAMTLVGGLARREWVMGPSLPPPLSLSPSLSLTHTHTRARMVVSLAHTLSLRSPDGHGRSIVGLASLAGPPDHAQLPHGSVPRHPVRYRVHACWPSTSSCPRVSNEAKAWAALPPQSTRRAPTVSDRPLWQSPGVTKRLPPSVVAVYGPQRGNRPAVSHYTTPPTAPCQLLEGRVVPHNAHS